jgi:phosphate starvation-inducible PhoH-like protein
MSRKQKSASKELFNSIRPVAQNEEQEEVLRSINENLITIIAGSPGVGKTFLATMQGISDVLKNKYQRLILSRPCVEAFGENLGFLPGRYEQKLAPYMMPIIDILEDNLSSGTMKGLVETKVIKTIPLAFMRGIEFKNSFVILDEAQNTIPSQIYMLLTRIGKNCKIVITGDPYQSDIPERNGLVDAMDRLDGMDDIGIVSLSPKSIIRHPIIEEIEARYKKDLL